MEKLRTQTQYKPANGRLGFPRVVAQKSMNRLLKEMLRGDPSKGMGKSEQLKHKLAGFWSKRISHKDRLIYKFDENSIYIFAIGGHYDDH